MHSHNDIVRCLHTVTSAVIQMTRSIPPYPGSEVITEQLVSCVVAVAASYFRARRCRSKLAIAGRTALTLQELAELRYWLRLVENRRLADVTDLFGDVEVLQDMIRRSMYDPGRV